MTAQITYPYANITSDLVASTMLAQLELVRAWITQGSIQSVRDGDLNKHFSWLALAYPEGTNRHFFDAPSTGFYPLRTKALREKEQSIPEWIQTNLKARRSPDHGLTKAGEGYDEKNTTARLYWREGPTRISRLIRLAFEEDLKQYLEKNHKHRNTHKHRSARKTIDLHSILSIVLDFLTVPEMPGTRAYALVALRNYMFSEIGIVPYFSGEEDAGEDDDHFTVSEIEKSLSYIWTSLRPRYLSTGKSKLSTPKKKVAAFLRHFLAMKGIFQWYFDTFEDYEDYLVNGNIWPQEKWLRSSLKFSKSPFLEKLPEMGELINEIWGLPLPIRGADTLFRGGLKFSSRQGLVMAIHGGPGTGKTSLALALGAYLAPFGIRTLFLSVEEEEEDLRNRIGGLVSDQVRRLEGIDEALEDWIDFRRLPSPSEDDSNDDNVINSIVKQFEFLKEKLNEATEDSGEGFYVPKPCRAIIVLDGVHDLFVANATTDTQGTSTKSQIRNLYRLIEAQKQLKALVILTTGHEWEGDAALDYLAEVTLHLTHESVSEYGAKPDRRIRLCKARHQLCAAGTHSIQIAGVKGVRFSPQINYQLDRRAIWKMRLPDERRIKTVLNRVIEAGQLEKFKKNQGSMEFHDNPHVAKIFAGSHVFLNGQGSGGKAALALKIALAPSFTIEKMSAQFDNHTIVFNEKVLVVSFLYPKEYYEELKDRLVGLRGSEYPGLGKKKSDEPKIEAIHLYPGHLKPNDLYNRIEWALDQAELEGEPYTCVIIDGIHNVFLQFPEIERYRLFWPQIYNSLRSRPVMTITTHTTLSGPQVFGGELVSRVDDSRSEPLRHALVQKSDFKFEIDSIPNDCPEYKDKPELWDCFVIKTLSAIGQPIPKGHVLWSREHLVLVDDKIYPSSPMAEDEQHYSESQQLDLYRNQQST